jgi:formylglycine-generating enzyme required for sulfatase activity
MNFLIRLFLLNTMAVAAFASVQPAKDMVLVPSGRFLPFTSKASDKPEQNEVSVTGFFIDRKPVSNRDFLLFVKKDPEWQRSNIKPVFSDNHYLEHWQENLKFGAREEKQPVVFVSWFAASAYCESLGKRLPTTNEWEYALYDKGRKQEELRSKILKWYSTPNGSQTNAVKKGKNGYGISGLGFSVWEWTDDLNAFILTGDSRGGASKDDNNFFCGNGSQMGDPSNYTAFMRYSFRSSLKANYTTANLGFRCVKDITK